MQSIGEIYDTFLMGKKTTVQETLPFNWFLILFILFTIIIDGSFLDFHLFRGTLL